MAKPKLGFEITAEDKSASAFASLAKNVGAVKGAIGSLAAEGVAKPADALGRLGINIEAIKDLNPEQQFAIIAEGLSRVDSAQKRAAIAADIFGAKNLKLLRMFKDGAAGIDEYRREADRLGFTFTDKAAAGFDSAASGLETFSAGMTAASRIIAAEFAPALGAVTKYLGEELPEAAEKGAKAIRVIQLTGTAIGSSIAQFLGRNQAADILRDQKSGSAGMPRPISTRLTPIWTSSANSGAPLMTLPRASPRLRPVRRPMSAVRLSARQTRRRGPRKSKKRSMRNCRRPRVITRPPARRPSSSPRRWKRSKSFAARGDSPVPIRQTGRPCRR